MDTLPEGVIPTPRPASRLLVLDRDDRLFLFEGVGDAEVGPSFWVPPGGGLHPGETYEEAAARELWEETGLVAPIGPYVWSRRHVFWFQGVYYQAIERYFIVRTETTEISEVNWEPHERSGILGYRWWHADEIAASDEVFVPRKLGQLLPPVLASASHFMPIEVGV